MTKVGINKVSTPVTSFLSGSPVVPHIGTVDSSVDLQPRGREGRGVCRSGGRSRPLWWKIYGELRQVEKDREDVGGIESGSSIEATY